MAVAGVMVSSSFALVLAFARSSEAAFLASKKGGVLSAKDAAAFDERSALLGTLYSFALIASIAFWLLWQFRAHANIREADLPGARTSPLLAVGGWFIPVANLVLPYRFMSELWLVSNGWHPKDPAAPKPWRVAAWWTAYVMGGIATNLSVGRIDASKTAEALRSAALLNAVALGAIAVAGVLAVGLLRDVVGGQRKLSITDVHHSPD